MPPLESSNLSTADPEYSTLAEAEEKVLKIAFMNMIKILQGIYENVNEQWKVINKAV